MQDGMIYIVMRDYLDHWNESNITAQFIELINKTWGEYREIKTNTSAGLYKWGLFNKYDAIYSIKTVVNAQTHFSDKLEIEIKEIFDEFVNHKFTKI